MPDLRAKAIQIVHNQRQNFLQELKDFASIPSISTSPEHKADIGRAAAWVAGKLEAIGMQNVKIMPTTGHPVVYGEHLQAGDQAPTMLIYGHYDVQPAEPLDLWKSGAFEPTVRGEDLFARGASDMKGQVMATIAAVDAALKAGRLPVNVKFLIEGEEEVGSPSLGKFIQEHEALLASDFALNPDTGMLAPDFPTITYALRGLAYFEVRVYGPDHDLHSGLYGGIIHNPAQVLNELIAGMHDENNRITLPGFYDRVRPLDAGERAALARLPFGEDYFLKQTGAPALRGEAGYTVIERRGARPTLEVNGLLSGFTGEGSKTVLPAWAMAKISCRLVPDQDPEEVHQQLLKYLEAHAPETVRWEVLVHAGSPASISDRESPWVLAFARAQETVWGKPPAFRREGGSVPVVILFQNLLGIESVNTGFGLPDDRAHSPNEKVHLPTLYHGVDALVHFLYNLV
jgi:acetylornithine deacetylase/succinyl-diaminopimelate desuccinylase-like protein